MITKSRLASHPKYAVILHQYNELLKADGKVNNLKFYKEIILPEIPDFHLQSWYQFLRRFKTETGIIQARAASANMAGIEVRKDVERTLAATLMTNDEATKRGISTALNLGAAFYEDLMKKYKEAPASLTQFEEKVLSDALHKAMKSQDSRIHALGKVREDGREQAKFERAFSGAASD